MVGVEIDFNQELCTGCGKCIDTCFIGAIMISGGKTKIDLERYRCCGRCAEICSKGAVIIKIAEDSVKRAVKHVEPLVNVELE